MGVVVDGCYDDGYGDGDDGGDAENSDANLVSLFLDSEQRLGFGVCQHVVVVVVVVVDGGEN